MKEDKHLAECQLIFHEHDRLAQAEIFLYAYSMTKPDGKASSLFSTGCAFGILSLVLGVIATFASALYQRHPDPACHGGGLSAGFPLAFLCDDSAGSPISSWGKIDLVDFFNMNPRVFLLDILLYSALFGVLWIVGRAIFGNGLAHDELFRWAVLLSIGYIIAFLFAFMSFQSSYLNFEIPLPRTPTPIIYTPTPFGTMPPPPPPPITPPS